ncbi:MAG: hypothetical protein KAT20_00915, partial [Desulfuromonadales bacterium]|nr:hypothetical protein [Desulfuromonadales bacterium]
MFYFEGSPEAETLNYLPTDSAEEPNLEYQLRISVKNSPFGELFTDNKLLQFISDLANNRSKGKQIERTDFLEHMETLTIQEIPEHDERKFKYFVEDYKGKKSAIKIFLG